MSTLCEQYKEACRRVAAAARRAGRDPGCVKLIAVSKTFPASDIREAYACGQRRFGESKASELAEKAKLLPGDVEWHFIGHLQSNKVKTAVECAEWIHSVDSVKLAERIDRLAGELGRRPKILFEVNVSGEAAKFGMTPEELQEAAALEFRHAMPSGLMTMAPQGAAVPELEKIFSALAILAQQHRLPELSMGMSGDFETAIACGATMVRIGSAIFGGRVYL